MRTRDIGALEGVEFRAETQAQLLQDIAEWWFTEHEETNDFLLDIRFDIREEDIGEPNPYVAIAVVDGIGSL